MSSTNDHEFDALEYLIGTNDESINEIVGSGYITNFRARSGFDSGIVHAPYIPIIDYTSNLNPVHGAQTFNQETYERIREFARENLMNQEDHELPGGLSMRHETVTERPRRLRSRWSVDNDQSYRIWMPPAGTQRGLIEDFDVTVDITDGQHNFAETSHLTYIYYRFYDGKQCVAEHEFLMNPSAPAESLWDEHLKEIEKKPSVRHDAIYFSFMKANHSLIYKKLSNKVDRFNLIWYFKGEIESSIRLPDDPRRT